MTQGRQPPTRRKVLEMIGRVAGGGAMYQAMASLGHAAESGYDGPVKLAGAKPGASVLVLGAGLAGLTAAYELRAAGYRVQILEYQPRAGGRCWTMRGGDEYTELGGSPQKIEFAKGNYFNPGPWRIPYSHHAVLDYCRRFGVQLEPFIQVNYNAFVHSTKAFAGAPQRFRHVQADTYGYVSELLSKATQGGALDQALSKEDRERLLEGLKRWGVLDRDHRYRAGTAVSDTRGYDVDPAGGLMPAAKASTPLKVDELLGSGLWAQIGAGNLYDFQSTIFQPVGGMDMLAKGFERRLPGLVRFNTKVTRIEQSASAVTVSYVDALKPGQAMQARADWCVCTIPLSVLSQIDLQVGEPLKQAIDAVPYGSSVKVGLEFKRRFWEEDEHIYGGISYTDQPSQLISYPSTGYMQRGPAVLLGAYCFENTHAYRFSSLAARDRIRLAMEYGSKIHAQYRSEFRSGVSVAWHRVPWTQGCSGKWSDELRQAHYSNLCNVDGRIVLAGEHASHLPAWQEGAILSALDAIRRLHAKASAVSSVAVNAI
jgi:monoamine oxidase